MKLAIAALLGLTDARLVYDAQHDRLLNLMEVPVGQPHGAYPPEMMYLPLQRDIPLEQAELGALGGPPDDGAQDDADSLLEQYEFEDKENYSMDFKVRKEINDF